MVCSNLYSVFSIVFIPIAADFQRGILGTSTKEVKDREGDEDQRPERVEI